MRFGIYPAISSQYLQSSRKLTTSKVKLQKFNDSLVCCARKDNTVTEVYRREVTATSGQDLRLSREMSIEK